MPQRTVYDNLSAAVRRVQFPKRALTPIPRGRSLGDVSEELQREVERLAPERVRERFATDAPLLRALPDVPSRRDGCGPSR